MTELHITVKLPKYTETWDDDKILTYARKRIKNLLSDTTNIMYVTRTEQ